MPPMFTIVKKAIQRKVGTRDVRIDVETIGLVKDVLNGPERVYLAAEIWNEMTRTDNGVDGNDGAALRATSPRASNAVHTQRIVVALEWGEPINVDKGVLVVGELVLREAENRAHLGDA